MIIDATNEVTLPQGRAPMGTVIGLAVLARRGSR